MPLAFVDRQDGIVGRRYCPRCNKCWDCRNYHVDLCPDCAKLDAQDGQDRRKRGKRSGCASGTTFLVYIDGRPAYLPLMEIAETMKLGYIPPDATVYMGDRPGRVLLYQTSGRGYKWRPQPCPNT